MQFKDNFSKSPKLLLLAPELKADVCIKFIFCTGVSRMFKSRIFEHKEAELIPIVVSCLEIEVVTDICFPDLSFHEVVING